MDGCATPVRTDEVMSPTSTASSKPSAVPKVISAVLAFALLTALGAYVPYTTSGRTLLGLCVVRIVNESGVPLRNIRFGFLRPGKSIADHREVAELADRGATQLWFHTEQLTAQEITFDMAGQSRQHAQWWLFHPGSILIIRIDEVGLSHFDVTD